MDFIFRCSGGRAVITNSILFISANYCAFQKRLGVLLEPFKKGTGKRTILISSHFGSLIFFRLRAAVRKLFQSRLKKKGVFEVTDANIHHHCLFSFGKVRGQLPVVDREKTSEQNTFIIKYYLVKIFTRV